MQREVPRAVADARQRAPKRRIIRKGLDLADEAAQVAAERNEAKVLSFDMGGTTAKVCLIKNFKPFKGRTFEVDRAARFQKGSGLPVRIPVIEMVEIGAGGGSIARVDTLKRITVGPDSAGADPGPACYGRGGQAPTVTDSDIELGKIDPLHFAGGTIKLLPEKSLEALDRAVAKPLMLSVKDKVGALYDLLRPFASHGLSMTKIESRPLRGKPWEYLFYLDFLGRADTPNAQNALNHLRELADFLRVLGCYPKGA